MRRVVACLVVALLPATAVAQGASKSDLKGGAFTPSVPELPDCVGFPSAAAQHDCNCPAGAGGGSVWGSGPYTADSDVCSAAIHAGIVGSDGGPVRLIGRPGQASYAGSTRNGVTTREWGSYGESFDVARVGGGFAGTASLAPSLPACAEIPAGEERHVCLCDSASGGAVWGSGPYTADSNICTAARHDGVLAPGAGGEVTVIRVGGLGAYAASTRNGVTTSGWGDYDASIVFDRN